MWRYLCLPLLLLLFYPVLAQAQAACTLAETPAPAIHYNMDTDGLENVDALFQSQILAFLNSGAALEDLAPAIESAAEYPEIFSQTVQADFTADNQADILVLLSLSWGAGVDVYLMLFSCNNAQYRHLTTYSTGGWDAQIPARIMYTIDLNNNQLRDIMLEVTRTEGDRPFQGLYILEWNSDALESIFTIGPDYGEYAGVEILLNPVQLSSPDIAVLDFFAYEEATAMSYVEIDFVRPITLLYRWGNGSYGLVCRHFRDETNSYFTILHSAETFRACGNMRDAKRNYQRLMLEDSTLQVWRENWYSDFISYPDDIQSSEEREHYTLELEQSYYAAFAAWRLTQIAVLEGDEWAVEQRLDWLREHYSRGQAGYAYAAMASAFWDSWEDHADRWVACRAASLAYDAAFATGDDPGIVYLDDSSEYHFGFYFYNGRAYAADPDNLFAVPETIDGMVSTPICL
jgi:hypothetical protein